jgi:hypothetical protein
MDLRIAALVTSVAGLFACAALLPNESTDAASELTRLMQRSVTLPACTASYRITGPIQQAITFSYSGPDRAHFEVKETVDGKPDELSYWALGPRFVKRSHKNGERTFAEVTFEIAAADGRAMIDSALERAIPFLATESSLLDDAPGPTLGMWFTPFPGDTVHGSFEVFAGWTPRRRSAFEWLPWAAALPLLRLEPDRIIGEDPRLEITVAISRSTGLIERLTTKGGLDVALVEWTPSVASTAFDVPPQPPDARDDSDKFRREIGIGIYRGLDDAIRHAVLEARRRSAIPVDDFLSRIAPVFELQNQTVLCGVFADLSDGLNRETDARLDLFARRSAASAHDPDLRAACALRLEQERAELSDYLQRYLKTFVLPSWPLEGVDAHDLELIDDLRRRIASESFDRAVTQVVLAHFDDGARAVREAK